MSRVPNIMFKSIRSQLLPGKGKQQPVEGLFCMYNHRTCMQNRLDGYEYCLKHILEDKNAPFKQCSYTSSKQSKRCTNASPKSDRKDGYCLEHSRRAVLIRQRSNRKKRPKETPEVMLEGLDNYANFNRRDHGIHSYGDHHDRRTPSIASKALEYASSSDSDAETPVVDQAWRGDADSDAESIDSEQEDQLKHAGVYTAEEVALIMRDKLIRLQSLYIDQFKRLQHGMKEKRRKYLYASKKERESFGGLGQYAKDAESQENLSRYNAMKRYHRRYGTEALLHRQSKKRRIAASEGSSHKAPTFPKCLYSHIGEKCQCVALPLSKYCVKHILNDPHQVLYRPCHYGDGECQQSVATSDDVPYCQLHATLTNPLAQSTEDVKDESADDFIDVTTNVPMEVSQPSETVTGLQSTPSTMPPGDTEQSTSQTLSTEDDLMKKGKLLLEHLKSLDKGSNSNSPVSGNRPSATVTSDGQITYTIQ